MSTYYVPGPMRDEQNRTKSASEDMLEMGIRG